MRSNLVNSLRKTSLGLLMGMGLLFMAGCAGEVYTPGYGGMAYYDYDYYPDWDVYYYPHDRLYYWNDDDGHWRWGHRVPDRFHLDMDHDHREHLQLHSRQPWTEHQPERQEFRGHYPGAYRR